MLLQWAKGLFGAGPRHVDPAYVRELIADKKLEQATRLARRLRPSLKQAHLERLCLEGEIAFRQNEDGLAEQLFRQVLAEAPGFVEAHYGLSLVMAESGRLETALEHAQFAKNAKPNDSRFLAQLGYCYVLLQLYPAAEQPLRLATKLRPRDKHAWNNLGIVLRHRELLAEAKACFLQALDIDPNFASAAENLRLVDTDIAEAGLQAVVVDRRVEAQTSLQAVAGKGWEEVDTLLVAGRSDDAIRAAERLADLADEDPETLGALAWTYARANDQESAVDILARCAEKFPDHSQTHVDLGKLLLTLERYAPAERALRRAIELGGQNSATHALHAACLHALERYLEAAEVLRTACKLDEGSPSLRKQLASTLIMTCDYDEAIALFDGLLAQGTVSRNEIVGNYACALTYAGRIDEALSYLDEAIEQRAYDPGMRMMRAIVHLLNERYGPGWDDYEWRNFGHTRNLRVLPFEKWRGEPLAGKRIVVLAEQGLGDQIMFASCIGDLAQAGASEVVVEVISRLAKPLERSLPSCRVIASSQKKDMQWASEFQADYYVALADLPKYFRRDRASFPGRAYLRADPARQDHWRKQLEAAGPRPWVGISWKGGTELTRTVVRTTEVGNFAALAQGVPATWVSLQYGPVQDALQKATAAGLHLHHWQSAIDDLDEFAALVSVLDAVVTVCNTTVHFAGALGKPTLVLAPQVPEWRYGLRFEKMPWYTDVTVLRQSTLGDWDELFQRAGTQLRRRLATPAQS